MANREKLIYGGVGLLLIVAVAFFVVNNQSGVDNKTNGTGKVEDVDDTDKTVKTPSQPSGKCGMENCHGLEITCGAKVPDACTEMYAMGDGCRQFASCKNIDGKCSLDKTPKFDSCKSCVEKCEKSFPNDPIKVSDCESECINN